MFGIFKRKADEGVPSQVNIAEIVADFDKDFRELRRRMGEYSASKERERDNAVRSLIFRLTIQPGWEVLRPFSFGWLTVISVADNGVLAATVNATEVVKWEDITDARPPKEDAR